MFSLFVLCTVGLSFFSVVSAAAFTPGNLAVCRVGEGIATLSTAATAVFIDEYTPTGTLVQSIPMPTTVSGANLRLTISGSSTASCNITRSADGNYLLIAGYDVPIATASVDTTVTTGGINFRVIGRIGVDGLVDTTTSTSSFSGGQIRGAASDFGVNMWLSGANTGILHTTFGLNTPATLIGSVIPIVTNNRAVGIFGGQLFASNGSGTNIRIQAIGTGLPTTTGQTMSGIPGFGTAGSPYGFYFADLDAGVPGNDTLYVSDDGATAGATGGGIKKFSLVAGSWTYNATFLPTPELPTPIIPATTFRGLTGKVNGNTVTLYATRNGTQFTSVVDATGYNVVPTAIPTLLATNGTNQAFRGIASVPCTIGSLTYSSPTYSIVRSFSGTITVQRPNNCDTPVSIFYETADAPINPATPNIDYVSASGTLNFASGETSKTFSVQTNASGEGKNIGLALSLQMSGLASTSDSKAGLQIQSVISITGPTAADGSINGRILSASGRGIGNVRVTLQSVATGEVRYVRTNPFGYYRFSELETGEDYVLSVASKRYTFAQSSIVINLNENLEGLNFIAEH
jgi:Carboxypeptidase regulatory-like domain